MESSGSRRRWRRDRLATDDDVDLGGRLFTKDAARLSVELQLLRPVDEVPALEVTRIADEHLRSADARERDVDLSEIRRRRLRRHVERAVRRIARDLIERARDRRRVVADVDGIEAALDARRRTLRSASDRDLRK